MRVLILSCTTGEGHNSCAKAIKEVYDSDNEYCVIEDALGFISKKLSNFVSKGHILLYRHFPKLFNFGYRFSENHPSLFSAGSRIYRLFSKGTKKLCEYITDNDIDTVICTHPFAAVILTQMQMKHELPLTTAFVATDHTCCPSVKDSNLDYYFIPSEKLISDFECDHITKDKIIPVGIPIKQMFYTEGDAEKAKQFCDVSRDSRHIVMMCGSMGCGPLARLAESIGKELPADCELTVICGTNQKLKNSLLKKTSSTAGVHIKGFVTDMPMILDSADLYITKPGGISTSEAAAKNTPMLFVNTVAACESYNLEYYESIGAAVSAKTVKELSALCLDLIADKENLSTVTEKLRNTKKVNSAKIIRDTLAK